MRVRFYLKRPEAQTHTNIFTRISYEGRQLKYYLPESIEPKFWNPERQRAREIRKFPEYPEFNARLDSIESEIKNTVRKYINDNRQPPSPPVLKDLLDIAIRGRLDKSHISFYDFFEDFIERSRKGLRLNPRTKSPVKASTLRAYSSMLNALKAFESDTRYKVAYDTLNMEFYNRFLEWADGTQLMANYIGKHIKTLKSVLAEATEAGHNKNMDFKKKSFAVMSVEVDNIALTPTELDRLYALDLSGKQGPELVRDLFIVGCYTGLRFSDFSILSLDHIKDGFFQISQTKTAGRVVIPIHNRVRSIMEKYDGQLPKAFSSQTTNRYLKVIAQQVEGMDKLETLVQKKGLKEVIEKVPRHSLVSTHTARRTFATLEYKAGTDQRTIMGITGHKSEKDFLKYLKVTSDEHAKRLQELWTARAKLDNNTGA
jgi:integrase